MTVQYCASQETFCTSTLVGKIRELVSALGVQPYGIFNVCLINGDDLPRAGQYSSHGILSKLISTAILLFALAQGITSTPSLAPCVGCESSSSDWIHNHRLVMNL
jgi:hypothetical protein